MELFNRLKKRFTHLNKWALKQNIQGYRLYERDIPQYPFIVDIYDSYALIYTRFSEIDSDPDRIDRLKKLQDALIELGFANEKQILKSRSLQKGLDQYEKINSKSTNLTVQEGPLKFSVNLTDYLDTGLFLDHRPLRRILSQKDLSGENCLNLFAYTASLSVAMAYAGGSITSIDMSKTYLDWAIRNFQLNQLDLNQHRFIQADILQFLADDNESYFQTIVCDPPTFSNSKRMEQTFDVTRDHPFLVRSCYQLLKPGGQLYFSTNKRRFKLDPEMIEEFAVKDISARTFDQDFRDQHIHRVYLIEKDPCQSSS